MGLEGQEEMVREQLEFKNLELGDNKNMGDQEPSKLS